GRPDSGEDRPGSAADFNDGAGRDGGSRSPQIVAAAQSAYLPLVSRAVTMNADGSPSGLDAGMRSANDEPGGDSPPGDFEILRELGRGGMGVVYQARQLSLNRKVALKVLASGLGLPSTAVQRFRREAEAAARLHHTNIVPIYATGEEDGTHFYAMELI